LLAWALLVYGRLFFARHLLDMRIRYWATKIMLPILMASSVAALFGFVPHLYLTASFLRVVVTTLSCEVVFVPALWFVIFDFEEREFVASRIGKFIRRKS